MDPDANLHQQRRIARRILTALDVDRVPDADDIAALAELVEAMDGWLAKGGFLPERWRR